MKVLQYVLAFLCALALMAGQVFGEAQVKKHETSIKVGEYNNENSLGYVQDVYNDIRYYKKNSPFIRPWWLGSFGHYLTFSPGDRQIESRLGTYDGQ